MGATGTLLIYVVVGLTVAAWTWMARRHSGPWAHGVATLAALVFWPVFLPFAFGRASPSGAGERGSRFDQRIREGELRLERALASLEGVAENLLAPQRAHVAKLSDGLRAIARRAEDMEQLLSTPEFDRRRAEALLSSTDDDAYAERLRRRLDNVVRLETMHDDAVRDLERALLQVEEIGSKMVLLRFAEDPDHEALRLLEELSLTVEGATEGLALTTP
ncbi:MAG: hypothetical protein RMA76_05935 [Deltaproteobacteria bacterium]|jgi:uncharacterized coiled-coil protein SlyX